MEPLISIIVNCHNGEKYLKECISSILNQISLKLFFNNSSKDNSKKIIDTFKVTKSDISIVQKIKHINKNGS